MSRLRNILAIGAVVMIAWSTKAQDGDLSLDDQFNSDSSESATTPNDSAVVPNDSANDVWLTNEAPAHNIAPSESTLPATNPVDEFATSPEISADPMMAQGENTDELAAQTNLASPIELRQSENALFGFSMGLVLSSGPFHEVYDKYSKGVQPVQSVDRRTDYIQNFGVMFRYAIAPFYGIGTDLNVSYARSQNHSSIRAQQDSQSGATYEMSEITTLKGEVNLTYAINVGNHLPIYFLAGLGAQRVSGSEIEKIISPLGYGGQAGMGFVINSTLNIEGLYSYYEHGLSSIIIEKAAKDGTYEIKSSQAKVINDGLVLRGSYSFNF